VGDSPIEKRVRILAAAQELLRAEGIEGTRMEAVAEAARVSKGTLYQYFESKQDLLLATIIDSYESAAKLVPSDETEKDPIAKLEGLLKGHCEILERVSPGMTVHYQAWGVVAKSETGKKRLYDFLRDFHRSRNEELEQILREGQRTGHFRDDIDASTLADGISAMLSGFLYRSTFDSEKAQPNRLDECFDRMVREMLTRLPSAETAGVPAAGSHEAQRV